MDQEIAVTGIWLRRFQDTIEVLAEFDGDWHLVIEETQEGPISHIVEVSGIQKAPPFPVTA